MEIRFRLDENFDAALIARVWEKANGGSYNLAAKFLMRHWYEIETVGISPPQRRDNIFSVSDVGDIRFKLDEKFDAGLIGRILQKANGSNHNLAAKFLMRHWREIEIGGILTPERQHDDAQASDTGDILAAAVADIEAGW